MRRSHWLPSYWMAVVCLALAGLAAVSPERAPADEAPVLNPANGHYYQAITVPGGVSWTDAQAAAASLTFQGSTGYLATITSAAENTFVTTTFPAAVSGAWFLGGYQLPNSPEPDKGWAWASGEPWVYTNWNDGEPNNANGDDALTLTPNGKWNDVFHTDTRTGYLVEFEPATVPPNGAPTDLKAVAFSHNRIDLTWTNGSTNEFGIRVERRTENGSFALLAVLPAATTTYSDTGLTPATAYTYRVQAVNHAGASAYSPEVSATTSQDPISFLPPVSYPVPNAGEMKAADFDGDGHIDIAISVNSDISMLWGHGDGTFDQAVPLNLGSGAHHIVAADVNGDGALDLLFVNGGSLVYVALNQKNRSFAAPTSYAVGDAAEGVLAADFDEDGKLDLAVANQQTFDISLLKGKGDGTFAPAVSLGGDLDFPTRMVAIDLNGDRHLDLAVTDLVGANVQIFFGNGHGGFQEGSALETGEYPNGLLFYDFDGDGKPDLVTNNYFGSSISILFSRGNGSFAPQLSYDANLYPLVMNAGDIDGDGDTDLILSNAGTAYFTILVNSGLGNFEAPRSFSSGGDNSRNLAVGDFNEDGKGDVAVAGETSQNVSIFINSSPFPLAGVGSASNRVDLAWNDSPALRNNARAAVTGYQVERRTGSGTYSVVSTVGAGAFGRHTYSDTSGLTPSTSYTYRVGAVTGGSIRYSREVTASTTGGKLSGAAAKLAMGNAVVGRTVTKTLKIKNSGKTALIGSVGLLIAPFKVVSGGGAFNVGPGKTLNVAVEFQPAAKRAYAGTLRIVSNQSANARSDVTVYGVGR